MIEEIREIKALFDAGEIGMTEAVERIFVILEK